MPQAIVDPEELRQFAQSLKKFSSELQTRINMLGGQLAALSKTWRDQEQKKFSEEFEQQVKGLQRLIEVIEEHIPYLVRKAEIIDEYLHRR
ncbi:MAG: WXG100 family type VII secretion target [Thermoguttaceae bacterium]|jgi:WXG100 family type VII secretion target